MTKLQLHELRDGDLIQSKLTHMIYLVTRAAAGHVTAVQEVDVVDAGQWTLISKGRYLGDVCREEKPSTTPP